VDCWDHCLHPEVGRCFWTRVKKETRKAIQTMITQVQADFSDAGAGVCRFAFSVRGTLLSTLSLKGASHRAFPLRSMWIWEIITEKSFLKFARRSKQYLVSQWSFDHENLEWSKQMTKLVEKWTDDNDNDNDNDAPIDGAEYNPQKKDCSCPRKNRENAIRLLDETLCQEELRYHNRNVLLFEFLFFEKVEKLTKIQRMGARDWIVIDIYGLKAPKNDILKFSVRSCVSWNVGTKCVCVCARAWGGEDAVFFLSTFTQELHHHTYTTHALLTKHEFEFRRNID
jgi:hypothetical protein